MQRVILVFSLVVALAVSCEKYEEGGSKNRVEKNLINSWNLESYHLDGTDKTAELLISDWAIKLEDNGALNLSYTDDSGIANSDSRLWVYLEEEDGVSFYDSLYFTLTDATTPAKVRTFHITRLKKAELWCTFQDNGKNHEFRMTAE